MTARPQRVLVVDADAEVRNVVEDLLTDRGFEVQQAADAEGALVKIGKDAFDVLLCHLTALRSDRGHLSQRLRELDPAPRVIAMSASGLRARSDEASANLPKPFTRAQLLEAIRPPPPGEPGRAAVR